MNKAILMGRLTKDPEMRQTPNGVSVARFSIAVKRRFAKEGQQPADFIECFAWRQTAEFVCKFFHKGSMVAVVGSIQSRSWDGSDGKKRYATEVVADEVYFTGEKTGQGQMQQSGDMAQFPGDGGFDGFDTEGFSAIDGSEDDLPF